MSDVLAGVPRPQGPLHGLRQLEARMSVLTDSDTQRFWDKVDRGADDECWRWLGGFFTAGYPYFWLRGSGVGGHRVMCAMYHGLAHGRMALHSCDNPGCVNPTHLRWGTAADNMADRSLRGRAPCGEDHGRSKLTATQVAEIRRAYDEGRSQRSLGREYGVTSQAIALVVHGKNWKQAA